MKLQTSLLVIILWIISLSLQAKTTELCTAVDGSGSIEDSDFTLQLEGLASAVESSSVVPQDGTVTISVVVFSSDSNVEIAPTLINNQATATNVAKNIRAIVQPSGGTNIPSAIAACSNLFKFTADRQVIDVSTDGESTGDSSAAADQATAKGVDVINALGIGSSIDINELRSLVRPQPYSNFPKDGFVIQVPDFNKYADAIKGKMAVEAGGTIPICDSEPTPTPSKQGYVISPDIWIKADIKSEEKGVIDAVWRLGGEEKTSRGDRVVWGLFFANPKDVAWGSSNNPDLYVKIWFDVSGRIDVNYFHVSVPDITVYTMKGNGKIMTNTSTVNTRYVKHSFYVEGTQSSSVLKGCAEEKTTQ